MTKAQDTQFEDHVLEKVKPCDNGWEISFDGGWCFFIKKPSPIEPAVGMTMRQYGKGFGFGVRGIDLNGVEVFYATPEQYEEKCRREIEEREKEQRYDFEKKRADMDRRYRALPEVFQRRIDKFRTNNPHFRWKFEGYEVFCCEQAVAIAKHVKAEDLAAFYKLEFHQQKILVPELDDGHSGNTFGCAVRLAGLYLTEQENVVKLHGALAPLVGSEEYGCVPTSRAK